MLTEKVHDESLDEHWVSFAMLHRLLERNPDAPLAEILETQFGGVDFSSFPNVTSFFEALDPQKFSDGFRALAIVAYGVATGVDREKIAAMVHGAFESPEAQALPEFIEAQRRFDVIVPALP